MSTPLGSEPAFPVEEAIGSTHYGPITARRSGLTKREWLAGTIAAGMWANSNSSVANALIEQAKALSLDPEDAVARLAIRAADLLLARLQSSASPTQPSATPEPPEAR